VMSRSISLRLRVAVIGAAVGLGTATAPPTPSAPASPMATPAAPDCVAALQRKLEQLVRDMSVTGAVVTCRAVRGVISRRPQISVHLSLT
jgi:hypothetical protein